MRSLERRFKIQTDKTPYFSSLVNFGEAVAHQRFSKRIIKHWFNELVEPEDYPAQDKVEIIEHMVKLSHRPKHREEGMILGENST